jgi:hypothetical protein
MTQSPSIAAFATVGVSVWLATAIGTRQKRRAGGRGRDGR